MNKIVLDLETQKSFDEVGGFDHNDKLGVSLVGVYDYAQDQFLSYRESELSQLLPLLRESEVIGFNNKNFDFAVLQPYFDFDMSELKYQDIMEDFENYAGHRIKLDTLAQSNLGYGKSGSGLDAIKYYRSGDFEKLTRYCLDDVRVTRDLYNLGEKQGYFRYTSKNEDGELAVPASWGKRVTTGEVMSAFARSRMAKEPIEIDYVSNRINAGKKARQIHKIQVLDFVHGGVLAQSLLNNEKCNFRPERVMDVK